MHVLRDRVPDVALDAIRQLWDTRGRDVLFEGLDETRIGYVNLYHRAWGSANPHAGLLDELADQGCLPVPRDSVVSFGFIASTPGCADQAWHLDYEGHSETFFVPLVDVTEETGTEYLQFETRRTNLLHFRELMQCSNYFRTNDDLFDRLRSLGVPEGCCRAEIMTAPQGALLHLPPFVLHRGRQNRSDRARVMFQLVSLDTRSGYLLMDTVIQPDAARDEDVDAGWRTLCAARTAP